MFCESMKSRTFQGLSGKDKDKDLTCKDQDKDKDLTGKDKDKDKDFNYQTYKDFQGLTRTYRRRCNYIPP